VIQIVNSLQPLGKDKALAVIEEYLRVTSVYDSGARERIFLILRVLFEELDNKNLMPRIRIGEFFPAAPSNPTLIPQFPIALFGDIPLLLVAGYDVDRSLRRFVQQFEDHITYLREYGVLRRSTLSPTCRPLSVLSDFTNSSQWFYGKDVENRYRKGMYVNKEYEARVGYVMIANQLLRLVKDVYPSEIDLSYSCNIKDMKAEWKRICDDFSENELIWDSSRNIYTFLNK
jgi:hypothetical protein